MFSFETQHAFSKVYRALRTGLKACEESGGIPLLGAPFIVDSDIDESGRSGEVSVSYVPFSGRQVFTVVTVKTITELRSAVEISTRYQLSENRQKEVEALYLYWIKGGSACKVPA